MQPTAPACFLPELAQFWTICFSPVGLLCAPICLVHSGLVLSQLAYRFGPGNPCLPLPSWPANCLLVHSLPSSSVGQPDACWCPVLLRWPAKCLLVHKLPRLWCDQPVHSPIGPVRPALPRNQPVPPFIAHGRYLSLAKKILDFWEKIGEVLHSPPLNSGNVLVASMRVHGPPCPTESVHAPMLPLSRNVPSTSQGIPCSSDDCPFLEPLDEQLFLLHHEHE